MPCFQPSLPRRRNNSSSNPTPGILKLMSSSQLVCRAKKILSENLYLTIGTATKSGVPWVSPVYTAYDRHYTFYWVSSPQSHHSKLIHNNSKVAAVVFNSQAAAGTGEGVYLIGTASQVSSPIELIHATAVLYRRMRKKPRPAGHFLRKAHLRIYKLESKLFWINTVIPIHGRLVDKCISIKLYQK